MGRAKTIVARRDTSSHDVGMVGRRHYMETLQPSSHHFNNHFSNTNSSLTSSLTHLTPRFPLSYSYPYHNDDPYSNAHKRRRTNTTTTDLPITTTTSTAALAASAKESKSNSQKDDKIRVKRKQLPPAGVGIGTPNLLYSPGRQLDIDKILNHSHSRIITIHIPADHATTNNACVKNRHIWGSNPYTDDSDIVAILFHSGFVRPTSKRTQVIDHFSATLQLTRANTSSPPFKGLDQNGIRSRSWTSTHEGAILKVLNVLSVRADVAKSLPPAPLPAATDLLPYFMISWQDLDMPIASTMANHSGEKNVTSTNVANGNGNGHTNNTDTTAHKNGDLQNQRASTPPVNNGKDHHTKFIFTAPLSEKSKASAKRGINVFASFSLTNEPYYIYNLNAIACVASSLQKHPIARFTDEVLYVENDTNRLEFSFSEENVKKLQAILNDDQASPEVFKNVNVRIALVKQETLSRELFEVLSEDMENVDEKAYPLALKDLEILHEALPWVEVQWNLRGVSVKGKEYRLSRMMFHRRTDLS